MTDRIEKVVTIINKRGLHARAAAKFVGLAATFSSDITVTRDGETVSGRSIMGLMMLAAGQGCQIQLNVRGDDAADAIDAIAGLIEAKFGED